MIEWSREEMGTGEWEVSRGNQNDERTGEGSHIDHPAL